jgi:hypothetical protein
LEIGLSLFLEVAVQQRLGADLQCSARVGTLAANNLLIFSGIVRASLKSVVS